MRPLYQCILFQNVFNEIFDEQCKIEEIGGGGECNVQVTKQCVMNKRDY